MSSAVIDISDDVFTAVIAGKIEQPIIKIVGNGLYPIGGIFEAKDLIRASRTQVHEIAKDEQNYSVKDIWYEAFLALLTDSDNTINTNLVEQLTLTYPISLPEKEIQLIESVAKLLTKSVLLLPREVMLVYSVLSDKANLCVLCEINNLDICVSYLSKSSGTWTITNYLAEFYEGEESLDILMKRIITEIGYEQFDFLVSDVSIKRHAWFSKQIAAGGLKVETIAAKRIPALMNLIYSEANPENYVWSEADELSFQSLVDSESSNSEINFSETETITESAAEPAALPTTPGNAATTSTPVAATVVSEFSTLPQDSILKPNSDIPVSSNLNPQTQISSSPTNKNSPNFPTYSPGINSFQLQVNTSPSQITPKFNNLSSNSQESFDPAHHQFSPASQGFQPFEYNPLPWEDYEDNNQNPKTVIAQPKSRKNFLLFGGTLVLLLVIFAMIFIAREVYQRNQLGGEQIIPVLNSKQLNTITVSLPNDWIEISKQLGYNSYLNSITYGDSANPENKLTVNFYPLPNKINISQLYSSIYKEWEVHPEKYSDLKSRFILGKYDVISFKENQNSNPPVFWYYTVINSERIGVGCQKISINSNVDIESLCKLIVKSITTG